MRRARAAARVLQQLIDLQSGRPHAHFDRVVAFIAVVRKAEAVPPLERAAALGRDDAVDRQLASARQGRSNSHAPRREAALQTGAEEDTRTTNVQPYW